jgi:hypothetical protein
MKALLFIILTAISMFFVLAAISLMTWVVLNYFWKPRKQ